MSERVGQVRQPHSQRGAIVVLALGIVTSALLLLGILLAVLQRTVVGSFIGTLADSAALAGASSIILPKGCVTLTGISADGAECSSSHRWGSAPRLAAEAIGAVSLPGIMFTGTTPISGADTVPTDGSEFSMAEDALTVRIERGMWRPTLQPDGSTPFRFTPLDDPMNYDRPGIPREVAFDAVRVTITAFPAPLPFARALLSRSIAITRTAIATVNLNLNVPVAPFAIPLCSLMKRDFRAPGETTRYFASPPAAPILPAGLPRSSTELYYRDICMADRLISPVSRYCNPANADCRGVVPQFNWDPNFISLAATEYARTGMTDYWTTTDFADSGANTGPQRTNSNQANADQFCFWGSPRYLEPEDNFGVAIVPSNNGDCSGASENSAILVDGSGNGIGVQTPDITLGSQLCVLANGFTSTIAKDGIWARISGTNPSTMGLPGPTPTALPSAASMRGGDYPLITDSSSTELSLFNMNRAFDTSTPPPVAPNDMSGRCREISRTPVAPRPQGTPPFPRWPRGFGAAGANEATGYQTVAQNEGGTCNSLRTGWGHWNELIANAPANSSQWPWYNRYLPPGSTATRSSTAAASIGGVGYWLTWAAVIADGRSSSAGGQGCGDSGSGTFDPRIRTDIPYEVVGYVRMQVYDLDIARRPPELPSQGMGSAASFPYQVRPGAGSPYTPAQAPDVWAASPYRWAFDRPDVTSTISENPEANACNVIRTRLSCRQPPMPVVGGTDTIIAPRLVEE